jgi:hypothetical protein
MLRRWIRAYFHALENEKSVVWGAISGVLWVLSASLAAALSGSHAGSGTRVAFYEISATVLPVLLLAYFVEHGAMTRSISQKNLLIAKSDPDLAKQGQHLIETAGPIASLTASSTATGEVLALYAVGTGDTSAFLLTGTIAALGITGLSILMFAVARIRQP